MSMSNQPHHEHAHATEHPACRDLLKSLSDYVDGELDESLCAEIERHMADCDRCQIVVDTLRKTVELYHETSDPAPLPSDVRARLFLRLNLDDFIAAPQKPADAS
jgi:anti-sigma factor RsiW